LEIRGDLARSVFPDLEPPPAGIGREPVGEFVGPFDEQDAIGFVEVVVPADAGQLVGRVEAVEVEVVDWQPAPGAVFVDESESGARHGVGIAAEAGYEACQTAVMSMGGMGYAQEYHVERYLREVLIPRIAPVSPHQIMNFIAERVLELPKSY